MRIIPPFRFSTVEPDLYRGGYPTLKNYRFLKRLKLKTIISVTPEPPICDLSEFCKCEEITLLHFPAEMFTGETMTITPSIVAEIVSVLISADRLPLFIHCIDGSNLTGVVLMCLRKLQHWDTSMIFSEFTRYTPDNSLDKEEHKFVSEFNCEVVVPGSIPPWLWGGQRISWHPKMWLKHDPPLVENDGDVSPSNKDEGVLGNGAKTKRNGSVVDADTSMLSLAVGVGNMGRRGEAEGLFHHAESGSGSMVLLERENMSRELHALDLAV